MSVKLSKDVQIGETVVVAHQDGTPSGGGVLENIGLNQYVRCGVSFGAGSGSRRVDLLPYALVLLAPQGINWTLARQLASHEVAHRRMAEKYAKAKKSKKPVLLQDITLITQDGIPIGSVAELNQSQTQQNLKPGQSGSADPSVVYVGWSKVHDLDVNKPFNADRASNIATGRANAVCVKNPLPPEIAPAVAKFAEEITKRPGITKVVVVGGQGTGWSLTRQPDGSFKREWNGKLSQHLLKVKKNRDRK